MAMYLWRMWWKKSLSRRSRISICSYVRNGYNAKWTLFLLCDVLLGIIWCDPFCYMNYACNRHFIA
jgi:hypothetical protein